MTQIDVLFENALARAAQLKRLPESTYRLQLHKDFTFRDAAAIVPYLARLGITHLYTSPILKATPGSTHGYDVIDQRVLNPDLGSRADLDALIAALHQHGLRYLLDTVPNHMGVHTHDNVFWQDVLENGQASRYRNYFDINWTTSPREKLRGKVLLPTLGKHFGEALEAGELKVVQSPDGFAVQYGETMFPLSPKTYPLITPTLPQATLDLCASLVDRVDDDDEAQRRHEIVEQIKRTIPRGVPLDKLNGTPGDEASFDALEALLARQNFRLAYWKTASQEINYRRFFDVTSLASLQMDRRDVFDAAHFFTFDLITAGSVDGLRVDHPDGLYDPAGYFIRLQATYLSRLIDRSDLAAEFETRLRDTPPEHWPLYVLAEKILAIDEPLEASWAIEGTSGYDVLNMINGLFVDASNETIFSDVYQEFTGQTIAFDDLIYEKKKLILRVGLASELHMLAVQLDNLAQLDRLSSDFTLAGLEDALREVIACFGVYRTYITSAQISYVDRERIDDAIVQAIARNPNLDPAIFGFIMGTLLQTFGSRLSAEDRDAQRRFAGKFQQLTSPTTAKGIEDTSFYIFNRLLSLNEVGGEPSRFGVSSDALHRYLSDRARRWPHAMTTLSTHDTKRSEDVRARLNVLSEMPAEWNAHLERWAAMNQPHRGEVDGAPVPDRNEEYALYQSILGAWPIGERPGDFEQRIQQFASKALREAKLHSGWGNEHQAYETAVARFITSILNSNEFVDDLISLERKLSHYGFINSLAQSMLKLTAPGVPDTYQGTELWDLSLVDPDNRRPVNYAARQAMLDRLSIESVPSLLDSPSDGRVKLWLHQRVLLERRQRPGLYTRGEYLPLRVTGSRSNNVFAFARRLGDDIAIVIVPRLVTSLVDPPAWPVGEAVWGDTVVELPAGREGKSFVNALDGTTCLAADSLAMRTVLTTMPVALLVR